MTNSLIINMIRKILSVFSVALLALLGTSCSNNAGDTSSITDDKNVTVNEISDPKRPANARYNLKSGIITFEATMLMMDQEVVMYFDDYGLKQRSEINISLMGKSMKNITLTDTAYVYSWDPESQKGNRIPVNTESPDNIDFTKLTEKVRTMYNIRDEGSEKVLGRNCKVYSIDFKKAGVSGKYYVWNGIALKTDVLAMGNNVKMTAIKIEENVAVPAEKFRVPSTVNFRVLNSAEELTGLGD
jgi:hypothetical protein